MKGKGTVSAPTATRSTLSPRVLRALVTVIGALILSFAAVSHAQTNVTPAQYLASQPKPNFAVGHHLPHLTRWGWQLSSNACVELARNWGYALDLNWAQNAVVDLQKSNSMESGFVALAKSDPSTYALSVLINRTFPAPIPNGFYCTNADGLFVDTSTNTWSDPTSTGYTKVISPEGPDGYWTNATDYWMSDLRTIRSNVPVAIVLNGGEYGLNVAGFGLPAWRKDPRVQSATNGMPIPRYTSNRKARQLGFLTAAIQKSLPDRECYIFYNTGNEQYRTTYYYGTNWFDHSSYWGWGSDVMVTNTDIPSFEDYFEGTWTSITNPLPNDILTRHLNAVGYNITLGHSTNYSWVCGGWGTNTANLSDIARYTGFLKCLYTAGMVGAVAGYFVIPPGGFDASFPADSPPHWLLQIMALGHVHALFSRVDNFIYQGDLLPGPSPHSMSTDQPAYEFTNTVADATARVLARKMRSSDQWLVTAWAADGPDRDVIVQIPNLGVIQCHASTNASVYFVNKPLGKISMSRLDEYSPLPAPPSDINVLLR